MNETKHTRITEMIEERIRAGVYPDKLPPLRELSHELQISTRTLSKALKPLFSRGVIMSDWPRGVMVGKTTGARKKTGIVGVFYSGLGVLEDDTLVSELKRLMAKDNHRMLLMSMLEDKLYEDAEFWSANCLDGYIFLYSSFNKKFVSDIKSKGVPFVAANWIPPEYGVDCVDFDHPGALRRAVEYLHRRGRRKIAMDFQHIKHGHFLEHIREEFLSILASHGIRNPNYFHCGKTNEKNFEERHAEYFLRLKDRPDAIIVYHPSAAAFEAKFREAGLECPRDIALLEYNIGREGYKPGKYPYLHTSYKRLARLAWDVFLKTLRHPEADAECRLAAIDFHAGNEHIS